MLLDSKKIPEIQRLMDLEGPNALEKIRGSDITLGVSLFLSLTHQAALDVGDIQLSQKIAGLNLTGVREGIRCLQRVGLQKSVEPFGSPSFDLFKIGSKQDLLSPEWILFYDRFRRSAANGQSSEMFRAVSGVLGEMGDNVFWHAFENESRPCPAIAGFFVSNGIASFCVTDFGQGFLQSLRRNPIWAGLKDDNDALDAVVHKHATSRVGEKEGGGFNDLFNSLLDFNGLVFLQTGDCFYQLENCGETRQLSIRTTTRLKGSSVSVIVSPRIRPTEISLKNIS